MSVFHGKDTVPLQELRIGCKFPCQAADKLTLCSILSASLTTFDVWMPKMMYRISVRFVLSLNQLPHPSSTAQTKSPANNTHLQTFKPKIKVNATAAHPPPRYLPMKMCLIAPKQKKSPESCIIPQITPKFERLIHPSPTVHAAHFVLECSQPRRHVRNLVHYLIASLMHSTIYRTSSSVT